MPKLILGSSSKYRYNLLKKIDIPFETASPDIDESAFPEESAESLVARLSLSKARALAPQFPNSLIIGSDQAAELDGKILTKPLNHSRAKAQLLTAAGRRVRFLTGLCLYNSADHSHQLEVVPYVVQFLPLSDRQIENYLCREKPYDCAGSFKAEGLGITLFERLSGDDPNALIGLPLIRLTAMLRKAGLDPLSDPASD